MRRPCGMCDKRGWVYMRTDLSNPDSDNEDLTTCPRCGGLQFVEVEEE